MSFHNAGGEAPGEQKCRYGNSKLTCRGPMRSFDRPYVAFLGGVETYGKFVQRPFAGLLEEATGRDCVNLGCLNGGIEAISADPDLIRIAAQSDLAVVQVLPAFNITNRFYRVHPRRNDRFVAPGEALCRLYPEMDFTRFHFNKHLLSTLQSLSVRRFATVEAEVKQAWHARMTELLAQLPNEKVLLWLRFDDLRRLGRIGVNSMLVDDTMIAALREQVSEVVEIPVRAAADAGEMNAMIYPELQAPAAAHMIGQATHFEIADTLKNLFPGEGQMKRPA